VPSTGPLLAFPYLFALSLTCYCIRYYIGHLRRARDALREGVLTQKNWEAQAEQVISGFERGNGMIRPVDGYVSGRLL
jgi:hypothetical protein